MNTQRKAIVLDMDETLEHGVYGNGYNLVMILRPYLDQLIKKLQEVKSQGTDIYLFTWGNDIWVNVLLRLKPELEEIFSGNIFSRSNTSEWPEYPSDWVKYEYWRDKYVISHYDLTHKIPERN